MIWSGLAVLFLLYLFPGSSRARAFNRFVKWIALVVGLIQAVFVVYAVVSGGMNVVAAEAGGGRVAILLLTCATNLLAFALVRHEEKAEKGDGP